MSAVVLVVDDDPVQRRLIENMVQRFGYKALTADGEPDIAAVFFAFARGRARLGDLMRLARDSNAAFAALGRCRARLGPALGIPAAQS